MTVAPRNGFICLSNARPRYRLGLTDFGGLRVHEEEE